MFGTLVLVVLVPSVTPLYVEPNGYHPLDVEKDPNIYSQDESEYPRDCRDVQKRGNTTSGVYSIKPDFYYTEPIEAYCDMDNDGGGWIRILNRVDGSQNFYLPYQYYRDGFGKLNGEFWWGLDHIHRFTVSEIYELLIQLMDWDSVVYNMHYRQFSIDGRMGNFALLVLGPFRGDLNNSLSYHGCANFSTIDDDNDSNPNMSCASLLYGGGGWWYKNCYQTQLTGNYIRRKEDAIKGSPQGIVWMGYHQTYPSADPWYSFKEARMMIRALNP